MRPDSAITGIDAQAWLVPTDAPEADGTLSWDSTTVLVVRLYAGGETGLGWSYTHEAAVGVVHGLLGPALEGRDVLDVGRLRAAALRAVRNVGSGGLVAAAISAVDVAAWDLKARLIGVSLVDVLGRARATAPVYGSGGFTTWDDDRLADEVRAWVELGCAAVKIKIGEADGRRSVRDLRRVETTAEAAGPGVEVFVDANGAYSRAQAVRVGAELDALGVTWFEEPVSSDDTGGLAAVRTAVRCDVAAGEYVWQPWDAERLLMADAVDCLQLDVTRCGGISGWLTAAAAADARGVDVSAHCCPQLSAHLVAATPRARHLEWFHDHIRLDPVLFEGTLPLVNGSMQPDVDRPGHGLVLRDAPDQPARRVA